MSKEGKDSQNINIYVIKFLHTTGLGDDRVMGCLKWGVSFQNCRAKKKKIIIIKKKRKRKVFFLFQSIPFYLFFWVSIIVRRVGKNHSSPSLWKGIPRAPVSRAYLFVSDQLCIFFTFHEELGFTLGFSKMWANAIFIFRK